MAEDEMVGWHHRLNGNVFEQTPGDSADIETWCAVVHGVTKSWTHQGPCRLGTGESGLVVG